MNRFVFAALLGLVTVSAWNSPAGAREEELLITILSPEPGIPIFGEVHFNAAVYPEGATIDRVELQIDGKLVATLRHPPFEARLDVGDENREHRFEARVFSPKGESHGTLLVSPAFRIDDELDAELRQLYITVTGEEDRPLLDLEQADFAIFDNGDRQQTVTFARGDVRLTAALLVDASASMRGERLRWAIEGAESFVRELLPADDAAVLLFSDHLLHASPFSNLPDVQVGGLGEVVADGGTALNDHIYLALKRLEQQQGRRVLVVLSDGVDSHSALRMEDVAWLARRSRALLYWIRCAPQEEASYARFSAWKGPDRYRAELSLLGETIVQSGGRIVPIQRFEDARDAFRVILRELREQYILGYQPAGLKRDGSWHQVTVRSSRGRTRTQEGYFAD